MKKLTLALYVRVVVASVLALLTTTTIASAQGTHSPRSKGSTSSPYGYYEYLPKDYGSSSSSFPVIIFLHGNGETGNGGSDLYELLKHGLPKVIKDGRHLPMLVLSPQTSGGWSNSTINEFVEFAKKKYRINPDKIYMTGLSLGGIATFSYAANYPYQLAAIVPISGRGSASETSKYASSVKLWAFHGTSDNVIHYDGSKLPVEAYNRQSPPVAAKLTLYSGVGHDAWSRTYSGSAGHDIYSWMLQYSRGSSKTTSPTTTTTSGISAPSSLTGTVTSSTSVKLYWKDNSSNESEFEIYMSAGNNSSYQLRAKAGSNSTAYTVGSLTSGQTYYFKVRAKNSNGTSSYSNEISAKAGSTSSTSNKAPTVSAGSDKSLTLPSSSISLYGSASDADGSIASLSWSKIGGPSASMSGTSSSKLSLSNLTEGTYTFRLTAKDNAGSTASDDVVVTVNKSSTTSTSTSTLAAPSNLYAVADRSTVAKLSWKDNSSDESEFEIYMSAGSNSNYQLRAKSGANSTGYTITNLVAGQTYYFKMRIKNSSGKYSAYSSEISIKMVDGNTSSSSGSTSTTTTTTSSGTSSLAAPSSLYASADRSTVAKLSWKDNSSDESEFEIYMSAGNNYSWRLRAKTGANSTAYTVTNLSAGQTYYYKIRVKNNSGKYSNYSNEAKLVMVEGNTSTSTSSSSSTSSTESTSSTSTSDFGAPAYLKIVTSTSSAVRLGWSDKSTTEQEFEIYMSTGNNYSYKLRAKTGANSTAYTITSLVAGQTYYFKVRAKDNAGKYTGYSNELVVKMGSTASRTTTDAADGDIFYTAQAEGDLSLEADTQVLAPTYSLYPNPASSYLDIALADQHEGETRLQLVDLSGKIRMEETLATGPGDTYRLNLENQNLLPGMYVLRISNGDTTKTLKFMKK